MPVSAVPSPPSFFWPRSKKYRGYHEKLINADNFPLDFRA